MSGALTAAARYAARWLSLLLLQTVAYAVGVCAASVLWEHLPR